MNALEQAKFLIATAKLVEERIHKKKQFLSDVQDVTIREGKLILTLADDRVFDLGTVGPAGPQGEKGDRGPLGFPGEKGEKGDIGEQGPVGIGIPGPKGDKGDQGERGFFGAQGERGLPGENGKDGEPGPKGEKGDVGPQGIQGDKGEKGDKGDQGEKGEKGDKGDPGKDATLDVEALNSKLGTQFQQLESMLKTRISQAITQMALAGGSGGGSANILDNDDVEFKQLTAVANNAVLVFDATKRKFVAINMATVINNIKDELALKYTKMIDVAGSLTYIGEANPGSDPAAAVWRISVLNESATPDSNLKWADGVATFTKVWNDRASYTYS